MRPYDAMMALATEHSRANPVKYAAVLLVAQERADDEEVCEGGDEPDLERRRAAATRDRAEENRHREREHEECLADPETWREHRDIPDSPHGGRGGEAKREMHRANHRGDADDDRGANDEERTQHGKRRDGVCGGGRGACCVRSLREDVEKFGRHRDSSRFGRRGRGEGEAYTRISIPSHRCPKPCEIKQSLSSR